ncbi:DUF309 domain-containing protein [Paenibacillus sp. OAS669]|uniref:DUF309 domain-containing protein n=1 Tax=Paenibacillus sp. OAS669 TaxID=2663821 RepID=UPI00178B0745|nr:DUF309 domain-containing protein [Paenibacillus sp. OAS669]MBE1441768.1 hypothetical protein [Paenibacillus sp. OAS669]
MSQYPQAYIDYLIYFHAERDYFECHEVMEAYWKEHPGDPLASCYVGLIQIAVALYHQRRNNLNGARKMMASAMTNLTDEGMQALGIDPKSLRSMLQERLTQLAAEAPVFEDINLPLTDVQLVEACRKRCEESSLHWQCASDFSNGRLIHKHKLRDRSSVIAEREQSRLNKAQQRGRSS